MMIAPSCAGRKSVRRVRRHVRSDLEHDLRVRPQRHAPRRPSPPPAVDEHRHPCMTRRRERPQPPRRQWLPPAAKHVREHQPRSRSHQDKTGRVERHQLPVAPSPRYPPCRVGAGRQRANAGGNEHYAVGGEQLDVHAPARSEPATAAADHRTASRRLEGRASPDRARLRQERRRNARRRRCRAGRSASRQQNQDQRHQQPRAGSANARPGGPGERCPRGALTPSSR